VGKGGGTVGRTDGVGSKGRYLMSIYIIITTYHYIIVIRGSRFSTCVRPNTTSPSSVRIIIIILS